MHAFQLYLCAMQLQAFITDLLFEHDCVVVPGFGGLVANYRPARLNRSTHIIYPPSKHIGYNRNLTNNDGLLVHHIAGIAGITYSQALAKVEEEVANCQHALNTEGRLVWEKIGVFFRDRSGQIQFVPEEQENYLLSSYGLSAIKLKYVANERGQNETPVIPITTATKRTTGGVWKIAAAAAIPLLVSGVLLLRNQLNTHNDFHLASFNPFESAHIVSDYKPRTNLTLWDEKAFETTSEETFVFDNATAPAPKKENKIATADNAVKTTPKPKATAQQQRGKYAVIGGAFKVKENANNFLKKLKAEGFDAQIAGTKNDLTLVAYGIYNTAAEADNAIQNILTDKSAKAWVKPL
jgi:cell division septation protein DedD